MAFAALAIVLVAAVFAGVEQEWPRSLALLFAVVHSAAALVAILWLLALAWRKRTARYWLLFVVASLLVAALYAPLLAP